MNAAPPPEGRHSWADPMRLWARLTDAPATIQDGNLRQRIRLLSILCISIVVLGDIFYLISHYGGGRPADPTNDLLFAAIAAGNVAVLAGYFLGRTPGLYPLGAGLLIAGIIAATVLSIVIDPGDYDTLIMILVVASLAASLLMSARGTLLILVASLTCAIMLPFLVDGINIELAINALTTIGLISMLILVSNAVRQHDLRTIERQARQLDESRQKAESANQLKGVFLGMVSHELRTPLNNILGYSDQMLMGLTGNLPGEAVEAAERIHRNGEYLGRMINDLLVLSRLESGSLTIVQRPFRPDEFLADINRSFRERAEAKGLGFITALDAELPEVMLGDPQRIEQIVGNLVSNAVKFTDHGSVEVHVRRAGAEEWLAEVRDTGIGLSEEVAQHVFDRFYQVDSSSRRSAGGAGLGLAIARELAILMGGSITLRTAPDKGSTFTVVLPLATEEADRPASQPDKIASSA